MVVQNRRDSKYYGHYISSGANFQAIMCNDCFPAFILISASVGLKAINSHERAIPGSEGRWIVFHRTEVLGKRRVRRDDLRSAVRPADGTWLSIEYLQETAIVVTECPSQIKCCACH